MKDFFGFYQNLENIQHPFRVFGVGHLVYIIVTSVTIYLCFRKYKQCEEDVKIKWQRGFAYYFFIQEMIFYIWIYFSCKENVFWEILQLELCTACLFVNFSTIFHQNKQVRFFGALMGLIGGPVAMIYPATVDAIYPVFSYRLINFYMTHGAYIFFSLMLMYDSELLNRKRFVKNLGIVACMYTAVYFFNLKFDTQYMFVGTPPEIGIIRMIYDVVGNVMFLPTVLLLFSGAQVLVYFGVKKLQWMCYKEA